MAYKIIEKNIYQKERNWKQRIKEEKKKEFIKYSLNKDRSNILTALAETITTYTPKPFDGVL